MNIFLKKTKLLPSEMTLDEVTLLLDELRIPTSLVFTPINLAQEKRAFFASDTYNPQFKYNVIKNKNGSILRKLSALESIIDIDPRLSKFYIELIKAKGEVNDLMHAVGNNKKFTEISEKRFIMPSAILFRNAARVLRGNINGYSVIDISKYKNQEDLTFDEISKILEVIFTEFSLDGWTAAKSMNIATNGVKVGIKKKEILMDKNIKKKPIELRKTIIHEFTHIMRAHNGAKTGYEALSKANLPKYLDIEEGLAGYNEEMMGVLKASDLMKRAAKTWAIYIGKDMSFRELYNATLAFAPKSLAFEMTYRVKRGLGDTSQPGIYARDVSYFRGFRRVRRKIADDSTIYKKLYSGKIDFNQTKWVDDGLIPKAKLIPTKEAFEKAFKKAGI